MKIVLDEGVPEGLCKYLPEHDVQTVRSLGWKGIQNGRLLTLVESVETETFITADKNLQRQQNLRGRPFATLLLSTNYWPEIEIRVEAVRSALKDAVRGEVKSVDCGTFVPKRFRNPVP